MSSSVIDYYKIIDKTPIGKRGDLYLYRTPGGKIVGTTTAPTTPGGKSYSYLTGKSRGSPGTTGTPYTQAQLNAQKTQQAQLELQRQAQAETTRLADIKQQTIVTSRFQTKSTGGKQLSDPYFRTKQFGKEYSEYQRRLQEEAKRKGRNLYLSEKEKIGGDVFKIKSETEKSKLIIKQKLLTPEQEKDRLKFEIRKRQRESEGKPLFTGLEIQSLQLQANLNTLYSGMEGELLPGRTGITNIPQSNLSKVIGKGFDYYDIVKEKYKGAEEKTSKLLFSGLKEKGVTPRVVSKKLFDTVPGLDVEDFKPIPGTFISRIHKKLEPYSLKQFGAGYITGVITGIYEKPLKTTLTLGLFLTLPVFTSITLAKPIGALTKLYPKATPLISKGVSYGLGGIYGYTIVKRVSSAESLYLKGFKLGEITTTELLPMGLGLKIGTYGVRRYTLFKELKSYTKQLPPQKQLEFKSKLLEAKALKGVSPKVQELSLERLKLLEKYPETQKQLLAYAKKQKSTLIHGGSIAQQTQLEKVLKLPTKRPGDWDIYVKSLMGETRLGNIYAGDIKNILKGTGIKRVTYGGGKVKIGGEKLIEFHPYESYLKANIEQTLPWYRTAKSGITKTPSGIKVLRLDIQLQRKLIGGYLEPYISGKHRLKDIPAAETIRLSLMETARKQQLKIKDFKTPTYLKTPITPIVDRRVLLGGGTPGVSDYYSYKPTKITTPYTPYKPTKITTPYTPYKPTKITAPYAPYKPTKTRYKPTKTKTPSIIFRTTKPKKTKSIYSPFIPKPTLFPPKKYPPYTPITKPFNYKFYKFTSSHFNVQKKPSGKFPVFVRRFGKWRLKGYGKTSAEAVLIGKKYTLKTLGRSFYVGGKQPLTILPQFRTKKERVGQIFIEKTKYLGGSTLGTRTEKAEIKFYRGLSPRKKRSKIKTRKASKSKTKRRKKK